MTRTIALVPLNGENGSTTMRARCIEEPSASSSVPQLSTREWTFVTSQKGNDRKRSWRYRGLRKKQSLEECRTRRECLTRKTGTAGIKRVRFSAFSTKRNVSFLALQNVEQPDVCLKERYEARYLNNSKEIISESGTREYTDAEIYTVRLLGIYFRKLVQQKWCLERISRRLCENGDLSSRL